MRSREVTVTLRVKYSIDEDKNFKEAYEVESLNDLTVAQVKAMDGNTAIIAPWEIVANADHVEITTWSLGPILFDAE